MRKKLLKRVGWIFCCIGVSAVMLTLNLLPDRVDVPASAPISEDLYDPLLVQRLQSINDLISYTDSIALVKDLNVASVAYWDEMASILRYRFYHGYSCYVPGNNWVAWLSGTLFWDHLHAIVLPDDIMKHPMAACSQQSIVMMACMKRKNIPYRSAEFAHHYAVEGRIDGRWRYFDTHMEPFMPGERRRSLAHYIRNDKLEHMYAHRISSDALTDVLSFIGYGAVSAPPAPRAALFHQVSLFLSWTLWLLPLVPVFYVCVKRPQTGERTSTI